MQRFFCVLLALAVLGGALARHGRRGGDGSSSSGHHDVETEAAHAEEGAVSSRPKCAGNTAVCGSKGDFDTYLFSQWWPSSNCEQGNCNLEYV